MSNINLVWDGATDDNQISAYQIQWRLSTSSPWSSPIIVSHNPNYPGNTINSGGGSYSHTPTQLVNHYFRIRTVDSVGQYSGYLEIFKELNASSSILISPTSSNILDVCLAHPFSPTNPIILTNLFGATTSSIVAGSTFVRNLDNSPFDGEDRNWRILLSGVSYNCEVNMFGRINNANSCLLSNVKSEYLSFSGYTSITNNTLLCQESTDRPIYYINTIIIGSIIYNTLNIDGSLSSPILGANKYYLITEGFATYVVKLSNSGVVITKQDYLVVCPNSPNTGCCFIKGTSISTPSGNVNIEDVNIDDDVITYNEEANIQEIKKVKTIIQVSKSNIIEYIISNDVVLKCTSCHPFWVINKGWSSFKPELTNELYFLDVSRIEVGDVLLTIDNKEVSINKITQLISKEVVSYNLEIYDNHTYYANGILVHNKLAPPPPLDSEGNPNPAYLQYQQLNCIYAP